MLGAARLQEFVVIVKPESILKMLSLFGGLDVGSFGETRQSGKEIAGTSNAIIWVSTTRSSPPAM